VGRAFFLSRLSICSSLSLLPLATVSWPTYASWCALPSPLGRRFSLVVSLFPVVWLSPFGKSRHLLPCLPLEGSILYFDGLFSSRAAVPFRMRSTCVNLLLGSCSLFVLLASDLRHERGLVHQRIVCYVFVMFSYLADTHFAHASPCSRCNCQRRPPVSAATGFPLWKLSYSSPSACRPFFGPAAVYFLSDAFPL